jgi:hypothetical protein
MNKFIKYHLYLYELFTLLITIWVLCTLIYYIGIYRFSTKITHENYNLIQIGFDISVEENITSDVKFQVRSVSFNDSAPLYGAYNGYIIFNGDSDNIIEQLNDYGAERCFIFQTRREAIMGGTYLNKLGEFFDDAISLILYLLIIVFVVFMKVNLTKLNLLSIKKQEAFSLTKYQYFFSYIIFHLIVLLIIPTLNRRYFDVSYDECFSMSRVYFNSMLFDRKFMFKDQQSSFDIYTRASYSINTYKDNLFYMHSRDFIINTSENTYVFNILLLCMVVWICKINSIFDYQDNITVTKRGKLFKIALYVMLYLLWLFFFMIGVLDLIDEMMLYYGFVFHNSHNLLNFHIPKSLVVSYIQIYFYIVFLIYSIKRKRKVNEKKNKNSKRGASQIKLLTDDPINKTGSTNNNM